MEPASQIQDVQYVLYLGTNMGMDACCGLYDEYYFLYIELGYVE